MALLIKVHPENPSHRQISRIVEVIRSGGLVVYPTDTVYALGCDITNSKALRRLARIKGVKLEKALFSFMCADFRTLSDYVKQLDNTTFKRLKQYLPGPYTFILPGSNKLPKDFKKRKTVGIRIPNNSIARDMVIELGNPIVCTSIHDEDEVKEYTTDPELLYDRWQKLVDVVVDGGSGGIIPSTVVNLCDGEEKILRQGKGGFL